MVTMEFTESHLPNSDPNIHGSCDEEEEGEEEEEEGEIPQSKIPTSKYSPLGQSMFVQHSDHSDPSGSSHVQQCNGLHMSTHPFLMEHGVQIDSNRLESGLVFLTPGTLEKSSLHVNSCNPDAPVTLSPSKKSSHCLYSSMNKNLCTATNKSFFSLKYRLMLTILWHALDLSWIVKVVQSCTAAFTIQSYYQFDRHLVVVNFSFYNDAMEAATKLNSLALSFSMNYHHTLCKKRACILKFDNAQKDSSPLCGIPFVVSSVRKIVSNSSQDSFHLASSNEIVYAPARNRYPRFIPHGRDKTEGPFPIDEIQEIECSQTSDSNKEVLQYIEQHQLPSKQNVSNLQSLGHPFSELFRKIPLEGPHEQTRQILSPLQLSHLNPEIRYPVSQWCEHADHKLQLNDYRQLVQRFGLTNRYIFLQDLADEISEAKKFQTWLSSQRFSNEGFHVELLNTSDGKSSAHVAFKTKKEAQNLLRALDPFVNTLFTSIEFTGPRRASHTLWIGNIRACERPGFQALGELVRLFSGLHRLRFIPEKNCVFVTYKTIASAVMARNFLHGLLFGLYGNQTQLNVDFTFNEHEARDLTDKENVCAFCVWRRSTHHLNPQSSEWNTHAPCLAIPRNVAFFIHDVPREFQCLEESKKCDSTQTFTKPPRSQNSTTHSLCQENPSPSEATSTISSARLTMTESEKGTTLSTANTIDESLNFHVTTEQVNLANNVKDSNLEFEEKDSIQITQAENPLKAYPDKHSQSQCQDSKKRLLDDQGECIPRKKERSFKVLKDNTGSLPIGKKASKRQSVGLDNRTMVSASKTTGKRKRQVSRKTKSTLCDSKSNKICEETNEQACRKVEKILSVSPKDQSTTAQRVEDSAKSTCSNVSQEKENCKPPVSPEKIQTKRSKQTSNRSCKKILHSDKRIHVAKSQQKDEEMKTADASSRLTTEQKGTLTSVNNNSSCLTEQNPESRIQDLQSSVWVMPTEASTLQGTCELAKQGQHLCRVLYQLERGNGSFKPPPLIDVSARTTISVLHQKIHRKSDQFTVWKLLPTSTDISDISPYKALCEYFIARDRIGLLEAGNTTVFIVPLMEATAILNFEVKDMTLFVFIFDGCLLKPKLLPGVLPNAS